MKQHNTVIMDHPIPEGIGWSIMTVLCCFIMDHPIPEGLYIQGPGPPGRGRIEYLHRTLRVIRDDVKGTQCPGV
jgi:hypothetical protein